MKTAEEMIKIIENEEKDLVKIYQGIKEETDNQHYLEALQNQIFAIHELMDALEIERK
ncbi:hypothetical protein [Anaerobutyricum hallii]|uniref:hypothetical protein n=1 Tax=Anaerobutyricum hallii TaxID=39488 RepID=UPI0014048B0A|nr:hypothetical protein [Anaerobutyricum hallii]